MVGWMRSSAMPGIRHPTIAPLTGPGSQSFTGAAGAQAEAAQLPQADSYKSCGSASESYSAAYWTPWDCCRCAAETRDAMLEKVAYVFGRYALLVYRHPFKFIVFSLLLSLSLSFGLICKRSTTDGVVQYTIPNSRAQMDADEFRMLFQGNVTRSEVILIAANDGRSNLLEKTFLDAVWDMHMRILDIRVTEEDDGDMLANAAADVAAVGDTIELPKRRLQQHTPRLQHDGELAPASGRHIQDLAGWESEQQTLPRRLAWGDPVAAMQQHFVQEQLMQQQRQQQIQQQWRQTGWPTTSGGRRRREAMAPPAQSRRQPQTQNQPFSIPPSTQEEVCDPEKQLPRLRITGLGCLPSLGPGEYGFQNLCLKDSTGACEAPDGVIFVYGHRRYQISDDAKLRPYALRWERRLLHLLEQETLPGAHIGLKTERSLSDELAASSSAGQGGEALMVAAAGCLIGVYVWVVNFSRSHLRSKATVSLTGAAAALLGFLGGAGVCYMFGVLNTGTVAAAPLLVVGIGVDDTLVILHSYSLTVHKRSAADRLQLTLRDSGVGITITTLTNITTFGIGAFSPYLAIQSFCLICLCGLFLGYVMCLTFFLGFLALDAKAEAAGKVMGVYKCYPMEVMADSARPKAGDASNPGNTQLNQPVKQQLKMPLGTLKALPTLQYLDKTRLPGADASALSACASDIFQCITMQKSGKKLNSQYGTSTSSRSSIKKVQQRQKQKRAKVLRPALKGRKQQIQPEEPSGEGIGSVQQIASQQVAKESGIVPTPLPLLLLDGKESKINAVSVRLARPRGTTVHFYRKTSSTAAAQAPSSTLPKPQLSQRSNQQGSDWKDRMVVNLCYGSGAAVVAAAAEAAEAAFSTTGRSWSGERIARLQLLQRLGRDGLVEPQGNVGKGLRKILVRFGARLLMNPFFKLMLLLLFAGVLITALIGCAQIQTGLDPRSLTKEGTMLKRFFDMQEEYFGVHGDPVMVYFSHPETICGAAFRVEYGKLHERLKSQKYTMEVHDGLSMFLQSPLARNVPEQSTMTCMQMLRAWALLLVPKYFPSTQENSNFMHTLRDDLAQFPLLNGAAYNRNFVYFESDDAILPQTISSMASAGCAVIVKRGMRAFEAVLLVGSPLLHGAISTQLAVVPLAFIDSPVLDVFFKMTTLVIIIGVTHGLMLLPVLLSLLGPLQQSQQKFLQQLMVLQKQYEQLEDQIVARGGSRANPKLKQQRRALRRLIEQQQQPPETVRDACVEFARGLCPNDPKNPFLRNSRIRLWVQSR
ncbi:lipid sterol:h+ related protein [Cyclospora cayetanensis]|uniref:Lipid sterol:h+ related protein n=1 Tax=Cyclospora cayetanensis TaxID=88456 RepID=A0A1D3CYL8_9EIME|nr:lipid sterol:h+ related protein [Cyclospora cayetanensis]